MTGKDRLRIEGGRDDEARAIDMVNIWSHSTMSPKPSSPGTGFNVMEGSRRLMQRMAARGPAQLFHTDFSVCNSYAAGEAAAARVTCPTLLLLGQRDMMTPPKGARLVKETILHARTVEVAASGHALMTEQPDAVLDALYGFATEL